MLNQDFKNSLQRAFINREHLGSYFDPKIIINQADKREYLLNFIQADLETCSDFFFSIAFITESGLNAIKTYLHDLNRRGIQGRLITSDYLAYNSPHVFHALLKIPNLHVRISQKEGFHSKGYLFNHEQYQSFIIGSSNLTMTALKTNYEWNIRLTSLQHGEIIHQINNHMETEWDLALPLTEKWIQNYQLIYNANNIANNIDMIEEKSILYETITPNKMQRAALAGIKQQRLEGAKRALIISATGTGKTYLAAFDVLNYAPRRMLFIVHREQILKDAMKSFKRVIGGKDSDYGILSGNRKDYDAKYLFATVQTMAKAEYHQRFAHDYFDYILIDEVHKAGAESYLRIINYFNPDFLLGMTATPERTDHFNIFELFNYNIAYEIRLQEAMEDKLLSPFHYFGITDYEYDGQIINEDSDLALLVNNQRVDFLIERIEYYGVSRGIVRGLVFCSRVEEAKILADMFSQRGYPSAYLSGSHSIEEREKTVEKLETDQLDYIFTVDIFNEGIDIPMINQVVLLRNTQSSIIFIQQLGRGLRKHDSKDFVTVIDFIGNYQNNYMIPMALTGDFSHNKDTIRKDTIDTSFIPGQSSINFEQIAKERIFKSIDIAKLDSMKEIRDHFYQLKNRLNRTPRLIDFQEQEVMDPFLIANKFDNYHQLLVTLNETDQIISQQGSNILKFVSFELLTGHRLHELILLENLILYGAMSFKKINELFVSNGLQTDSATLNSVIATLTTTFYQGVIAKGYQKTPLIEVQEDIVALSQTVKFNLTNQYFKNHLNDVIETAKLKNLDYQKDVPLTLYKKYRRRDILRMLNWEKQIVDQNISGYTRNDTDKKFINFITLNKDYNFKGSLVAYENKFLDNQTILWYTKAPRTLKSPEVKILQNFEGWTFYQFMKKSDDEGIDFYYLGKAMPLVHTIKEVKRNTKKGQRTLVELDLRLENPIPHDLFQYLTNI